uniref:Acid phosphatase 1 isoform X2 n=1 Tax=Elaeis guineensis var. tenera TaxID=51953 RepID=A0A8N4EU50_ELAGV|nr:acid phosphatase 1 isoform X2 [Elaeis guineensis]
MGFLRFLSLLFVLSAIASAAASQALLRMVSEGPSSGDGDDLYCDSWRLSAETNNAGYWKTIPAGCLQFVAEYMNGDRFLSDSAVVAAESLAFAQAVQVVGDGKDIWIFDVDETLLSNLPYYVVNGYGSEDFNETAFDEWVNLAKAPALPASLRLYEELLGLGFQVVFLTGRVEAQRNATVENLSFAGYHSWNRLILRVRMNLCYELRRIDLELELMGSGLIIVIKVMEKEPGL